MALVSPIAAKAVAGVLKGPANAVRGYLSPESYAAERVGDKLAQDGLDLGTLGQRLDDARTAGASEVALADVAGENSRRLLRTATNISGPGRDDAVSMVRERMASQPDRVQSALSSALANPDDLYPTIERVAKEARLKNKPAYDAAYNSPIDYTDPNLESLLQRVPPGAINEANRLMKVEGVQSKQILANVADDGAVTFKSLPERSPVGLHQARHGRAYPL